MLFRSLNATINDYLRQPSAKEALAQVGLNAIGGPPSVVNETVAKDKELWAPLIKDNNLTLDN